MSDQTDLTLDALLLLCTDKEQVALNIQNLKQHRTDAQIALKAVEDAQSKADARLAEAKQVEDQNAAFSASIVSRETELKKSEAHWLERNDKQLAESKEFNEEKLQHAANVRQLGIDRSQLETDRDSLTVREAMVKKLEDQTKALNDEATKLRDEHKARLDKLKSFASEAASG